MKIRKAALEDIDQIMEIYGTARQFMADNGNQTQWAPGHPSRERIHKDVNEGVGYVIEDNEGIQGVFAFILGEDSTYGIIEKGRWLNDTPYGTIHRLASSGRVKGIAAECFDWCCEQHPNVRVDTHENNKVMQHLIEKSGFIKCGRIYAEDGTPRIAYQKVSY